MTAQHTPFRLRWKKEKPETGLAAIGRDSSQRPSKLHDGVKEYAMVYSHGYHHRSCRDGWYWVAFEHVPYINTCNEPVATEAEAKAAALAYVRAAIARATHKEQT